MKFQKLEIGRCSKVLCKNFANLLTAAFGNSKINSAFPISASADTMVTFNTTKKRRNKATPYYEYVKKDKQLLLERVSENCLFLKFLNFPHLRMQCLYTIILDSL